MRDDARGWPGAGRGALDAIYPIAWVVDRVGGGVLTKTDASKPHRPLSDAPPGAQRRHWEQSQIEREETLSVAESAAYQYTAGSGPFNKYLLYSTTKDVDEIPEYGNGPGGVAGNNFDGIIGPPLIVHKLYKTIQAAPRPSKTMHFIRSVTKPDELPHRRTGVENPEAGSVFPNVTFISTSLADPDDYLSGALSTFFDTEKLCCFMIITTPPGFPMLPLVVGKSAYDSEREIVLPAGTLLIYRETIHDDKAIPGMHTEYVCYDAALPSAESINEYQLSLQNP